MPDVVPIVRRPVKKLSSPPDFESKSRSPVESSIGGRKFNLPSDKNSVNKIRKICDGKTVSADKTAKSKESIVNDEELPAPVISTYDVSQFSSNHQPTKSPKIELKVAKNRVAKTNVSHNLVGNYIEASMTRC